MGDVKVVFTGYPSEVMGDVKLYDVHIGDRHYSLSSTGNWFVKVTRKRRASEASYYYWRIVTSNKVKARLEFEVNKAQNNHTTEV